MEQPSPFLTDILRTAGRGTFEVWGQSPSTLAFAAVSAVGIWIMQCRRQGRPVLSLPADWWTGARDVVMVTATVLLVVFMIQVGRAIVARDARQVELIGQLQKPVASVGVPVVQVIESPNAELRSQISRQDVEIANLRGELQKAIGANEALSSQLNDRNKRGKQREELGAFRVSAERLINRCRLVPSDATLERDAEKWFADVRAYLKTNLDPSYEMEFVNSVDPIISASTPADVKLTPERLALWKGLSQRANTLDRFIRQFRER